ncbi:MAG: hypothetical protein SXQ77_04240 [Halobacteria archaeon]|nr:hypothetical protein [Halobacteria archaeon]
MSVQDAQESNLSSFEVIHKLSSLCDFDLEDRQKVQNPRLTTEQRKVILEKLEENTE